MIDNWSFGDQARPITGFLLGVERARVLTAMNSRREAEAELDHWIAKLAAAASDLNYSLAMDACCQKGFLRQEAGDDAGARAAWKQGAAIVTANPQNAELRGPFRPSCSFRSWQA
jgi:hypothetical protein